LTARTLSAIRKRRQQLIDLVEEFADCIRARFEGTGGVMHVDP
jgi:hypothetical protein